MNFSRVSECFGVFASQIPLYLCLSVDSFLLCVSVPLWLKLTPDRQCASACPDRSVEHDSFFFRGDFEDIRRVRPHHRARALLGRAASNSAYSALEKMTGWPRRPLYVGKHDSFPLFVKRSISSPINSALTSGWSTGQSTMPSVSSPSRLRIPAQIDESCPFSQSGFNDNDGMVELGDRANFIRARAKDDARHSDRADGASPAANVRGKCLRGREAGPSVCPCGWRRRQRE